MPRLRSLVVAAAVALSPATALAQYTPTIAAVSGQSAPGTSSTYNSGMSNPALNASGQAAFEAGSFAGTGIYAGVPGSVQSVAFQGRTAPGTGGLTYSSFSGTTFINVAGQVAFLSILSNSGTGVFAGLPGSVQAVAYTGQTAPGTGGATYAGVGFYVLNGAGQVAFNASLTGGSASTGVFVGAPGSVQPAALIGQSPIGAGTATYSAITGTPTLNGAGQVAFTANLTGGSASSGVFVGAVGSVQAAALQGQTAPVTGTATYSSFVTSPAVNGAGQVAFGATLSNGFTGVFVGAPGSVQTAALRGQPAPGAGTASYNVFGNPVVNGAGQVAFHSTLTGGGTATSGVFAGAPGSILAAAVAGQSAPGTGTATYSSFGTTPSLNGAGQVVFTAVLGGTGVTTGVNDAALFAGAPGAARLVVRTGDQIDVDPTAGVTLKTVSAIGIGSVQGGAGGEDGRTWPLNDAGVVAARLTFTDNTQGVYLFAPVPEPATVGGLAAAGLGLVGWGRRRRAAAASR